ncbi:MAG: peptidylprolyl isomerase [Desulfobacterales bacterium]|nr:peptidylprolyl isomerase [Desulfobacterales bacterium]
MKTNCWTWFLALATALALATVGSPALAGEKQTSKNKARVAVVNGSVITRADFNRETMRVRQRLFSMGKPADDSRLAEINRQALENLIARELLYQETQKRGIKIDETAVGKQFMTLKQRFPSENEFKDALTKANLSEASIKSQFRQDMAIQQLIHKKFALKVAVSGKEIKAYYDSYPDFFKQPEQVQAGHILIKVGPKADESQKAEARKKIEKIREKLQEGGDFAALAKEFSQCPSSAKGGDLGYFRRGQMAKPFEEAAFALKPGKLSDIVETMFGYHVIKVIDKKPESKIAYKDIKDRLEQYLKQEKVNKEVSQYVEELKGKAKVERFIAEDPQ